MAPCAEFHKMLGLKVKIISKRMYLMLNGTHTEEFVILKGLQVADLGEFTYDIFDIDRKNNLSLCEIDASIRMVTNEGEADPNFLQHIQAFFNGK